MKSYPYSLVAKTVEADVQFFDDLVTAYIASAISCAIMYPLDSYKTRQQLGKPGIPPWEEGGVFGLWKGVQYFIADANDAVYVAVYSLIKPALLAPVNPNNPTAVFIALCLSGSLGDAVGSVFRLPAELITKQIQCGAAKSGGEAIAKLLKTNVPRVVVLSWLAILCRDMPFAGLQIALYDLFKNLLSFLDEAGVNIYVQRLLWGALAGSTAAFFTTPFDILTTNILTAAQDDQMVEMPPSTSGNSALKYRALGPFEGVGELFYNTIKGIGKYFEVLRDPAITIFTVNDGGPSALFTGAIARVLFFGPAAMIFFFYYEALTDILSIYYAHKQ